MMPLGLLCTGEKGEVVTVSGCGNENRRHVPDIRKVSGRIEDIGLRAGKEIEMLNNEGRGVLLLKVDESRIAISRSMAMKIMVRRT